MMDDGTKWMIRRGEERDAKAKKKKKRERGDKTGKGKTRCYVIKENGNRGCNDHNRDNRGRAHSHYTHRTQ